MEKNTNYCYKGSTEFVIENGILKGADEPYLTEHNNFGDYLLEKLKAAPEFIGLIDGKTGENESFEKMMEKSVKCAMWLKEQNVQPGDIVGICTHNQMDMYVPCFASLYIGAVLNPWWNTGITSEMSKHFLTLGRPKIFFADEASADYVLEVAKSVNMPLKIIVFGNLPGFQSLDEILESQDPKKIGEFQCTKLSSHADPAVILFTSGSTGLPKGVIRSHKFLFGNVNTDIAMGGNDGNTISLNYSAIAWGTGIRFMVRAAISRETRIIYPEFSEETTFQLIEKFKINWILLSSTFVDRLQKSPARTKYDLSSLKYLYVTGGVLKEAIHQSLAVNFPQTSVRQVFGMTETGAVLEQHNQQSTCGSCGTIVKNVQMKVIDTETGVILGPNQPGEACFKSEFMMTCYYKNPKATNETIDAEGWLHTGDLVHYDEKGNVYVTDRIKDIIKYRNHRVSPSMIEQVLQGHPAVFEVGVVAKPNEIDGEHPMAFVAKVPDAHVTEEELEKLVATKLPDYMRLRGGIEFLDALPRTPSQKISKSHLKNMAQSDKA